jgi:hypothetical protein
MKKYIFFESFIIACNLFSKKANLIGERIMENDRFGVKLKIF